eukprot:CAMPEP_0201488870 /NCGR_PEP_ID=MMETSP0151_2-20130828/19972_1 /ASSEMBLY_ACC=CAM_ASM_000257 /TAXON_ID=200890 /ORGANISM="Paramoeba atlantica, Strain 621/1 / CCAP 1560/9" /LENGTH=253 /DNA_ID=CAMNT_0047874261 /DNA_START=89 /DNA_END=850 /DNA_ORIENTATION=+
MANQIVKRLRDLSVDEENREVVIQSQSNTRALVVFLGNSDPEVTELAIEALYYLSESVHLRETLSSIAGLSDGVKNLMFSNIDRVRDLAIETYKNIQSFLGKTTCSSSSSSSSSGQEPVDVDVDIEGMTTEEDREDLEQVLLNLKGIISFQIDLENERVAIRSKLETNTILDAIERNTSFLASVSGDQKKEEYEHDYLTDDEEETGENKQEGSFWGFLGNGKKSTSVVTMDQSSQPSGSQSSFWSRVGTSIWG